jgi:hypothetical protein
MVHNEQLLWRGRQKILQFAYETDHIDALIISSLMKTIKDRIESGLGQNWLRHLSD